MSIIFKTEKWLKEKMFGCQTCAQCILTHTQIRDLGTEHRSRGVRQFEAMAV
ncbi:MAG: hypothetical protein HOI15_00330 [Opitutales bacterium]|nr:hypothetical protein [Opitutales bacterium]